MGRRCSMEPRFLLACAVLLTLMGSATPSCAQHGNYLLGTLGLLGGAQAPEGIYYQNVFSHYHASGSRSADVTGELLRKQLELHGRSEGDIGPLRSSSPRAWALVLAT